MADVGADEAGRSQADLGVEVGAVHVHLAAVGMDDGADLADRFLEHAVGRRVGDHQAGQVVLVGFGLGLEVGDIDVAVLIAIDDDDLHVGHLGRRRVGAMRRFRDQADIAMAVATAGVVARNGDQAGVFALGTGVRLHADGVEAGDGLQPVSQAGDHFQITCGLIARGEGVQTAEFRPGDRDHLAGRVELHGARAKRDHRVVERQVLVLQRLEVAQHLVFGVVRVEHRMLEDGVAADQCIGQGGVGGGDLGVDDIHVERDLGDQLEQRGDIAARRRFVERNAEHAGRDTAQVVTGCQSVEVDGFSAGAEVEMDGVVELLGQQIDAGALEAFGQDGGQTVDTAGDGAQAFSAVIDGVHAGHVGQQDLRRTDVGVGFLATDVLFAGLQRHAVGRLAAGILGQADDAARHRADEGFAGGEESGVRAAEAHRDAEALAGAERDVGAHGARRLEQDQCHQVGGDSHRGALGLEAGDRGAQVADIAAVIRILEQGAEEFFVFYSVDRCDHQFEAEIAGTGPDHVDGLREAGAIDQETVRFRLGNAACHGHGFGGGGRFVEQRRIGDFHAGQVDDDLLEIEQRFQAALGDLGLVGRVSGVPARVFQHVAQDDLGRQCVVIAHADAGLVDLVLAGNCLEVGQRFVFAARCGQRQVSRQADGGWNGLGYQLFDAGGTNRGEHGGRFGGAGADVAGDELVALLKRRKREIQRHGNPW